MAVLHEHLSFSSRQNEQNDNGHEESAIKGYDTRDIEEDDDIHMRFVVIRICLAVAKGFLCRKDKWKSDYVEVYCGI